MPPNSDRDILLRPREATEIAKTITRILRLRGRRAPPIDMQHLSALFVIEWPYDYDKLYPGRRERIFRADVIQQLGFPVDELGRVSLPGAGNGKDAAGNN